ncbi:MAG: DNA-3-methyladenine glycosylase I [Pseudomonadales bacterium]|nr:DNA-3-methyladenine glycosylase I [Pseudomonadales bacterium]
MTDNQIRCGWCVGDAEYVAYHDEEWGVPITDAPSLFKLLTLEGMQAGLSWLTILRKRAAMEEAFYDFQLDKLAASGEPEITRWLDNAAIIRHRGKLQAMINNARLALETDNFVELIWQFRPASSRKYASLADVPALTDESTAMSKTLKKAGFKFVGPTICYAFMQSAGLVNDHTKDCWRFAPCDSLQARIK